MVSVENYVDYECDHDFLLSVTTVDLMWASSSKLDVWMHSLPLQSAIYLTVMLPFKMSETDHVLDSLFLFVIVKSSLGQWRSLCFLEDICN